MKLKPTHPSSFRDPSGHIAIENGEVFRVINPVYFRQYKALKASGFYDLLIKKQLLIAHQEFNASDSQIVLKAERIPFVTYPYEWSFEMYKEAALLTLKLQKVAVKNGFSLKDASAFNVTFHRGRPVFIDTLSFDFYKENTPWRAYKQFVMHFLGPLLLAKYFGSGALGILRQFIDGVPLNMLSSMLPFRAKLNPIVFSNIHLLARSENKYNEAHRSQAHKVSLSKKGHLNIIESLYRFIKNLKLKESTEWGNYYNKLNYSEKAFDHKAEIINQWISPLQPSSLIDIGGNDGTFVRKLDARIPQVLVCDVDNKAVDINYSQLKAHKETTITPFILDVLQPSPAIGFNNTERFSFLERIKASQPDVTLALAIIHHMSITGNIPFDASAEFFAKFSETLIIEFPGREDSWVKRLLKSKADFESYFGFYNQENFENSYFRHFTVIDKSHIKDSDRTLYFLKRK